MDDQFEELVRRHTPFLSADEELTPDLPLRDFGLDSMGIVELLASLESAYGVRFVNDALQLEHFATPESLWQTLTGVRAAAA